MLVDIVVAAEAIEPLQSESQRLEPGVTAPAGRAFHAVGGDGPTGPAGARGHGCGVRAGGRGADFSEEQVLENEEPPGDHRCLAAAFRQHRALRQNPSPARDASEFVAPHSGPLNVKAVVCGESRGEIGELRIEQVRKRPSLMPDQILEEGGCLGLHIRCQLRIPLRVVLAVGAQGLEPPQVEPLGDEFQRAGDCPRIGEHPADLASQLFDIVKGSRGRGGRQGRVRRLSPDDVAEPCGEFVGVGRPTASIALLLLDSVEEPRRLQHGFHYMPDGPLETAPRRPHGFCEGTIQLDFAF